MELWSSSGRASEGVGREREKRSEGKEWKGWKEGGSEADVDRKLTDDRGAEEEGGGRGEGKGSMSFKLLQAQNALLQVIEHASS